MRKKGRREAEELEVDGERRKFRKDWREKNGSASIHESANLSRLFQYGPESRETHPIIRIPCYIS